ncbi:MAG: DNA-3-methyladenine glycosylase [Legionella sp.]|nr:DNA-3-methyladenine glycosylase [Legionella sp.]
MKKLTRAFYNRDTRIVAQELLGCQLVHRFEGIERIGTIVEVEAYLGQHDLASHTSKGLTKRTSTMFGPPGHAYVYLIYGMYYCFNIVTEPEGIGSAVLIRAIEPIANIQERTSGPGLLCKALNIDTSMNGCDLLSENLFVNQAVKPHPLNIVAAPRIGVSYAKEWAHELLRFYIKGNTYVSRVC